MLRSLRHLIVFATVLACLTHSARAAEVTLAWDPNPETDIAGYYAYCLTGTNVFADVFTVTNGTSVRLTHLAEGASYTFWVTAYNTAGLESEPSEILTYVVPGLGVAVSWSPSPDASASSYRFSYGEVATPATTVDSGMNTSAYLTNLVRGKTYYFYARAHDSTGAILTEYQSVTYSVPLSGSFPSVYLDRVKIPPSATLTSPLHGSTYAANSSITVSATATDSDGSIIRVDFYAGSTLLGSDSAAPYSIAWTLVPAGTYQVRAVASDSDGLNASSSSASIQVISPPGAPVFTSVIPTSTTATLQWTDAAGELSYTMYRAEGAGSFALIANLPADTTRFTSSDLNPNTTYYFRLVGSNTAGSSLPAQISITTLPLAPETPSGFAATASNGAVTLTWSGAARASSYDVYRSTAPGGPFLRIRSSSGTSTIDSSVINGATYFYYVVALNSGGASAPSAVRSATPDAPPNAPTNLSASAQNGPQVALKWRDQSFNERSFVVERSVDELQFTTIAVLPPNTTVFTDANVISRERYYYRVSAENTGGSNVSNMAQARTR